MQRRGARSPPCSAGPCAAPSLRGSTRRSPRAYLSRGPVQPRDAPADLALARWRRANDPSPLGSATALTSSAAVGPPSRWALGCRIGGGSRPGYLTVPPGNSVWDQSLAPSTASFWLAQLCSSTAGGESHSWPSWLPTHSDILRNAAAAAVAAPGVTEKRFTSGACAAGLAARVQRSATLFQQRQLSQALAPLAWLRRRPALLQTNELPLSHDQPLRAPPRSSNCSSGSLWLSGDV